MTYTPMTPPLTLNQRSASSPANRYTGPVLTHGAPLPTPTDGRQSTNPRPGEPRKLMCSACGTTMTTTPTDSVWDLCPSTNGACDPRYRPAYYAMQQDIDDLQAARLLAGASTL